MDELEQALLTEEQYKFRSMLAGVRREAIMLRRYLAPQRDAFLRLQAERIEWFSDLNRIQLREITDKVTRFIEDLDAARDRASVTYEELVSRLSETLNRRTYVLSIVAGIFLPLGFLTGLLGISVGGIPGNENPWGFITVVIALALLFSLQLILFRWKNWF